MFDFENVKSEFIKNGGILKTSELNLLGLTSRQIKRLVEDGNIIKIKYGFYELSDYFTQDEVIIARLFPDSVIFLESALMHYDYTDRIPSSWQIAVDKDSEKSKYKIDYPSIEPFYIEKGYMNIGLTNYQLDGIKINIFNRDRTICDVLKYEKKLDKEIFNQAIKSYLKDDKKNLTLLYKYSKLLNIKGKVKTFIGVWL
ncbi:type IV toxin-antitoxin system AbiEi family antitoxin domain-containing protein [Mycoplasmatota bacterium]|nr:type IV toxin-antitoxin system AbiEi family antitoxin domain-containing protein [Mycoplasmatota bacterium]